MYSSPRRQKKGKIKLKFHNFYIAYNQEVLKMKNETKKLVYIYLILVLIKFFIAIFIVSPLGYADNYVYLKMSQSIVTDHTFQFDGVDYSIYPPLYPIVISISNIFENMGLVMILIKLINSLLINAIIFPIYYIAKRFMAEKKSVMAAVLTSIIPPFVLFPAYVMSENLFYPLFIFSIFCMYQSIIKNSLKWDILTGIFIGLSYLTKINALALIAMIISMPFLIIVLRLPKKQLLNKSLVLAIAFLVISPWLVRNGMLYGFNMSGIWGQYAEQLPQQMGLNLFSRSYWTLLHVTYQIVATGIIFFVLAILALFEKRDKGLSVLAWLTFLAMSFGCLLAGYHNGGNANWKDAIPHGRYIAMALPLIILVGFIAWDRGLNRKIKPWHIIALILLFILSWHLIEFPLFPVNNMSLVYFGIMGKILGSEFGKLIALLFIMLPCIVLYLKSLELGKAYRIFAAFFIIVSILGYSIIFYSSNIVWYNYEVSEMGRWVGNNIDPKETIAYDNHPYDSDFKADKPKESYILYSGMWFTNRIRSAEEYVGNYLVSKEILDLKVLYETEWEGEKVRLYERIGQ